MNGIVVKLRNRGIEAEMTETVAGVDFNTQYQVYRIDNGNEVVLGTVYIKKITGSNKINLNYLGEVPFDVQLNDLVRSI